MGDFLRPRLPHEGPARPLSPQETVVSGCRPQTRATVGTMGLEENYVHAARESSNQNRGVSAAPQSPDAHPEGGLKQR